MKTVKEYAKRMSALEREYESWKEHYKEISEYLLPRKGRFLDLDTTPNDGSKRHRSIIDNSGGRALRILAAGMQSGLTSPARPWFKLGLADKDKEQYEPVKWWLEEVRNYMLYIFHQSNFYTATHNTYYELGAFGTGAMGIDSDYDTMIRCYPFTVGEYYLSCDLSHRVDSIYRNYWATVRNLVETYGEENCSESTNNQYKNGNGDNWIRVCHIIEPNPDADPRKLEAKYKPFKSVIFEHANHRDKFLRQSGYDYFPVMAPRWSVTGTDVYGISPGMESLGDVRMLQQLQRKVLRALDKLIDPPMNAPASMESKALSIIPGGINYIDSASQTFTPAYQVNLDVRSAEYKIERVQQAIQEGFFADLFLLIANAPKQMTATEVVQRHEEKLLMLGPVIERIQPELLDRVIDRTFTIMDDAGVLPVPPEEIQGMDLEVEYISLLAQAQKMVGLTAIEQTAAFVGNLAAVKPEVLDKLDADEAVDQYASMVGVPPKIVVPDEKVIELRKVREQKMIQQQGLEQGLAVAQGAKTLSETKTGENNALDALMGRMGMAGGPQP